jgi:Ca-activated chloride channel family protein
MITANKQVESVSGKHRLPLHMMSAIMLFVLSVSFPVAAEWGNWWQTPEQRAKTAYESGDVDTLKRIAPDPGWQGIAEHASGAFEAAAESFNKAATQQDNTGNTQEATRALYNRGVSEVLAGQYENAVDTFDQVLQRDPEFDDAEFNRDIARQLIRQQQQAPSSGEGSEQENDSQSDEQQNPSDSQQDSEQQSSSGDQQSDSQNSNSSDQTQEESGEIGDSNDSADVQSQAQQLQDQQAAQEALQAESQAQRDMDNNNESSSMPAEQQAISEDEQATEQWLRRIPDDPTGLLRRKLEQSHRIEYPEVRDAQEPW